MDEDRRFKRLTPVDEALSRYLSRFKPIDRVVDVDVREALNRVPYRDIKSPIDIPPFNRSAMDGYAVRSIDVSSASFNNPVRLKVIGISTTQEPYNGVVGRGEAVRIDTGAVMPEGADSVVMLEYTEYSDGYIEVFKAVSPLENVSVKGEDVKRGDVVVRAGYPLTPYDISMLYSIGLKSIEVYDLVSIGIASIGSELREIDVRLGSGEIRDVNRPMYKALLSRYPVRGRDYGIIPDDRDRVLAVVRNGLEENDLMITIGGSSLGRGDIVSDIADEIGEVVVHGVALYPSRPVLLIDAGKPYIGVPGYPVAAAITFHVFLEPLISLLAGIKGKPLWRRVKGVLTRRVASKLGLRHYVRIRVLRRDGAIYIEPIYSGGAGVLSSLSLGDGFLVIPENVEGFEEGDVVEAYIYRGWIP